MKRGHRASAESSDTGRLHSPLRADLGQNFQLFIDSLYVYGPVYLLLKSILNPLPHNFDFGKHLGKGENTPFSHNVFYPSLKEFLSLSYIYFVVCKCVEFGPV